MGNELPTTIVTAMISLAKNKKVRKEILGKYSDGTERSLWDTIHGEFLSPQDKEKYLYKNECGDKKNKKKKKKNKKKKKKSKAKIVL